MLHRSIWSGRPNRLLLSVPPAAFVSTGPRSGDGNRVSLQIGNERVTLKQAEYERMLRDARSPTSDMPPA